MLKTSKQKEFIDKIAIEQMNVYTAAKELNIPANTAFEWLDEFNDEIFNLRMAHATNIIQEHGLTMHAELEYLAKIHSKLRKELENRDFSGLPTDKLYTMLTDVRSNIDKILSQLNTLDPDDFYDEDDEFDDYDEDDIY
jgi:hypothetical protein